MLGSNGAWTMAYSRDSYREIEDDFPNIVSHYEIVSDEDEGYNCIAFAVGDTHQYWDPAAATRPFKGYYWPPGCGDDAAVGNLVRVLRFTDMRFANRQNWKLGLRRSPFGETRKSFRTRQSSFRPVNGPASSGSATTSRTTHLTRSAANFTAG